MKSLTEQLKESLVIEAATKVIMNADVIYVFFIMILPFVGRVFLFP